MKIITDNAVYVQKIDIAQLTHSDKIIPASIMEKVFNKDVVIIDDSNRYEFIKFEDDSEIEYFKGIDWMIDYNEVKELSDSEINEMGESIARSMNNIANQYNSMTIDERKKNLQMTEEHEKLEFKMYSLRDIVWLRDGRIKMPFPKELGYLRDGSKHSENKLQKKLRQIFSRNKK